MQAVRSLCDYVTRSEGSGSERLALGLGLGTLAILLSVLLGPLHY